MDQRRTAADYLIASKQCEILGLEQLLRTGRLVVSVSNLVHALQRERGASNMYVASDGQRFAGEITPLRACAADQEAQFRACLNELDVDAASLPGASRLFSRIAQVIHGLEELRGARETIDALDMDTDTLVTGYSELVQGLLAVVFEAADSAADPDISRVLVAMFHLMQGKEFAGRERAVGAAGFARGGLDAGMIERLRQLIENQERCFEIFAEFADGEPLALWRDGGVEPCPAELERLRRIAFSATRRTTVGADCCDRWFDEASRRIDAMKRVEDRLEATLESLCQEKIAAAEQDLRCHRDEIEVLAEEQSTGEGFALFANGPEGEASGAVAANDVTYAADVARSQLGRSLADLVQSQSRRLQVMSEELNAARAALNERKTIEKAKGLIMRHRKISEEEAYRFLRQVAMSQSRRLADVAADTVTMEDILKQ